MEIIGSKNSRLDMAAFASDKKADIMSMAYSNAHSVFISKDAVFNDSPAPTLDQIIESMKSIYYLDNIREDTRAAFPSREKIIMVSAKNTGAWGGVGIINDIASTTLIKSHLIICSVAELRTSQGTLPSLASHIPSMNKGYILVKLASGSMEIADSNAIALVEGENRLEVSVYLHIRCSFVKAGIDVEHASTGVVYNNRVRYSKLPGLKAAKIIRSFYNGNHSKVEIHRSDQMVAFGNLSTQQYRSFENNINGRHVMDVCCDKLESFDSGFDNGANVTDLFETNSATGSSLSDLAEISKFAVNSSMAAPISGSVYYQEDIGLNAPKLVQPEDIITVPFGDYITRHHSRTIASGSYGRTVHDISVSFEEKSKMFYLAPNDIEVRVVSKLIVMTDNQKNIITKYVHESLFPYIGDGSKIEGGNIIGLRLANRYVEMDPSFNDMIQNSTTIDRAEIFRSGTQDYPSSTSGTITFAIGSHGLLTPSLSVIARQSTYDTSSRADADAWYKAGIVKVMPRVVTTSEIVPSDVIPTYIVVSSNNIYFSIFSSVSYTRSAPFVWYSILYFTLI